MVSKFKAQFHLGSHGTNVSYSISKYTLKGLTNSFQHLFPGIKRAKAPETLLCFGRLATFKKAHLSVTFSGV